MSNNEILKENNRKTENFENIKKNLHKLEIVQNSVEEYLDKIDFKINKFNLSDIFEYMSLENYRNLMKKIYDNADNNAILAYWNLIVERNSEKLDCTENKKNNIGKNFQRMKEFDKRLHKKDKTFFYTDFVVEKVIKYGNN